MLYDLKIFQKVYDFNLWLKPTVQRFAKAHKYSLGIQLENEALFLLKQIIKANMQRGSKKIEIEQGFIHYETIKVLLRLSKDYKLLNIKQYEFSSTPRSILDILNTSATTTITIGDDTVSPTCLKLGDKDGGGWTYCKALNGVLSCSVNSCE